MTDAEKAEARKAEVKKDRGSMANRIGDICLIGLQSESGPRVVENAELIEFANRGEFIAMKFRFQILHQAPITEPTPENPNPPVKEIVTVVEQWYDKHLNSK